MSKHEILLDGCRDQADCPSGTECDGSVNIPLAEKSRFGSCRYSLVEPELGIPRMGDCAVPTAKTPIDRDALIRGFNVPELALTRHTSDKGLASFTWKKPEGTREVACALFGCAPALREFAYDGSESGTRVDIANYGECALADAQFTDGDGIFEAVIGPSPIGSIGGAPGPACTEHPLLVTRLLVACWAYDDAQVSHASQLIELGVDEVTDLVGVLAPEGCSASDASNAQSCVLPDGTFGSCHAGACRRRCRTSDDCCGPRQACSPFACLGEGAPPYLCVN